MAPMAIVSWPTSKNANDTHCKLLLQEEAKTLEPLTNVVIENRATLSKRTAHTTTKRRQQQQRELRFAPLTFVRLDNEWFRRITLHRFGQNFNVVVVVV